jgi:Family of unknown function (DUF6152)
MSTSGIERVRRGPHHLWLGLAVCVALSTRVPAAFAHHSFAMYDSEKLLLLDGQVKEFQWTNPHAIVWVTGSTQPGEAPTLWTVELPTSPGNLSRMGWTKTSLVAGAHVVVEINPLRDGRHGGSFKKATLNDGTVLVAIMKDEPPDDHDHDHDAAEPGSAPAAKAASGCALGEVSGPAPTFTSTGTLFGLALLCRFRRARSPQRATLPSAS